MQKQKQKQKQKPAHNARWWRWRIERNRGVI
jgi:hypothetical protein